MHPWVCLVWAFGSALSMFISVGTVPRYSLKLGGCSLPVYSTCLPVYYPYGLLDAYSTCVTWTHTPLKLPPGAALSMSLWRGWEMDVVVQNFSAGKCCNSVSSSERLRRDAPKRTFQWCCGPSGEHISKCEMYTSEDLSAEYQMLLLLELLWTEKETHYIVLNKAEGSNFAWNVNRKYVKNKSTGFCLSNVN